MSRKSVLTKDLFFSRTSDFLEEFLIKQCGRSKKTKEAYMYALSVFKNYVLHCGKTILNFRYVDCTYSFLLDYKAYMAEKLSYSPSSVNQRLAAIKSYVKYSAGCDSTLYQVYMGISSVPFSTVTKKQGKPLPEKAVSALLDAPPETKKGLRDTVIMSLLFDTAIRLDELVTLETGDIYRNDGYTYLLIHGKGNKERKVSLDKKTVKLLDLYLKKFHAETKDTHAPLIYTIIKGKMNHMSHRNIQKMLKKYAEIGSEKNEDLKKSVHPHLLRSSRASDLYQNGTSIEIVSLFLGHSSVETTRSHYAFPSLEQLRSAIEAGTDTSGEEALWKDHEDELAKLCGLR